MIINNRIYPNFKGHKQVLRESTTAIFYGFCFGRYQVYTWINKLDNKILKMITIDTKSKIVVENKFLNKILLEFKFIKEDVE